MMFKDWKEYPHKEITPSLLWEYDLNSPDWDWDYMKVTVVQRVIELGRIDDYYAMFQKYGGFNNVANIVKQIPKLSPINMNWVCTLFNLEKEYLLCYTKMLSRKKLFNY